MNKAENNIRIYITKSKAGHYTITARSINPRAVVYRHRFIDSLEQARSIAKSLDI